MPAAISTKEVAEHLFMHLIGQKDGIGILNTITITYRDYETAMRKNNFVSSDPTIRGKWKALIGEEILIEDKDRMGRRIGIINLNRMAEFTSLLSHLREKGKQTNKHTHTVKSEVRV